MGYEFPRVAFLPDSPEGVRLLHGLYLAWNLRVLFTVGTSRTTGRQNAVVWNHINLKTFVSSSAFAEHSYPDPNHLRDLAEDLDNYGITQAEISSHMEQYPDLQPQPKVRLPSLQSRSAPANVDGAFGLGAISKKLP